MRQYEDFLRYVLENGATKTDQTGTGTISVLGGQLRFDLSKSFPLITTKKIHWKSVVHELIWFLKGDTNIQYLKDHNELRLQHQERAVQLKRMLSQENIEVLDCACTHIVPVMVRDAFKCKSMSDMLLNDHGIFIQPINFPTVEEGQERLRIAPTPLHTDAMMSELVQALVTVFNKHK